MGLMTIAHRYLWELPRNTVRYWQMHGPARFFSRLGLNLPTRQNVPLPQPLSQRRARKWQRQFPRHPKISLIVPLSHANPEYLEPCLNSIVSQYYQNWELILVEESSRQARLRESISRDYPGDSRIHTVAVRDRVDWAQAANAGINVAQGKFVAFLDVPDELTPDALTWMVAAHNRQPEAVWFYSDQDTISNRDQRSEPFFKPAYSPAYLLSSFYTGQLSLYSATSIRQLEGFRLKLGGSPHHDLALRLSERVRCDQVVHIPRILYHKRESVSPTQADHTRSIVREALARRGLSAEVQPHPTWPSASQIRLKPQSFPSVRILIPTHNGFSDLKACLESIHRHTRYPNYRTTVIDNRSNDETLINYLKAEETEGNVEVVRDPRPFNHSQMHNDVIADCDDEFVVFMNNDVELLTPGWLGELVATAEMDSAIAGVGTLLLFPDRTVQHGGIMMGRLGVAGHLHRDLPEENPGYFGQAHLLRELSGATAALLLMRRSAFMDVGGFDEQRYPTSFNDVDLWIRLGQRGYHCLYNPAVKAIHHESKTREVNWPVERKRRNRFRKQWAKTVKFDPFYNPNLSLQNETYPERQRYRIRSWKNERFRYRKLLVNFEPTLEAPRAA